jgi:hypothetical protein
MLFSIKNARFTKYVLFPLLQNRKDIPDSLNKRIKHMEEKFGKVRRKTLISYIIFRQRFRNINFTS